MSHNLLKGFSFNLIEQIIEKKYEFALHLTYSEKLQLSIRFRKEMHLFVKGMIILYNSDVIQRFVLI